MYKALIDAVVAERGFTTRFSPEEEKQAAQAAGTPHPADAARLDCRDRDLITIDGEDAHDFDDAVSCRRQPDGGILLLVAIADVSAYVSAGSALDAAAQQRGNSVYLPDRVLPMLPTVLSNDTCSLRPQEDRLALCCEMDFSAEVKLRQYRFVRAVIRSAARLNYDEAAIMMNGSAAKETTPALLWELAQKMRQQRAQRGGMLLEKPETTCTLSKEGKLSVETKARNIAHWAIEEAMIAANRCAADFLIQQKRPALHRIHPRPAADKVQQLTETLAPLGIHLPRKPQAADFAAALNAAEMQDAALQDAITPLVLGTLSRAEYAPDEKTGHFGLACPRYTHFTSPIRRYADLLTHRAIVAALNGEPSPLAAGELTRIGAQCGEQEVSADKAGWECRQRLLCVGAQEVIGCEYEGYVSGIAPMGFFVYVKELGIDGMVRLATLPGYWRCDVTKRTITAPDNTTTIKMADKINVRLDAVTPEKGRAELSATDYRRR